MKKKTLANQLRRRQINLGIVKADDVIALSDDEIIDSYNKCPDCNERNADPEMLRDIIATCRNVDDFVYFIKVYPKFAVVETILEDVKSVVAGIIESGDFNNDGPIDLIQKGLNQVQVQYALVQAQGPIDN